MDSEWLAIADIDDPTLRPVARRELDRIGRADLVIGIPTYCSTKTVGMVVQTVLDGVAADFSHLRVVLVNADAARSCQTHRAVADAALAAPIPVVVGSYTGKLGRGSAVRAILQAALDLSASAVVVLDAHTTSITSDWISALARPILQGKVDLMMPRYRWPLPSGGLGDLIFYPLIRALWGRSLRQPGAGDCALSSGLAQAVVDQDVWETEVAAAGFEVWLSCVALTEGPNPKSEERWALGQVDLGEKTYVARRRRTHFATIFRQAVGTLMRQVHLRQAVWQAMPPVEPVATFPGPPVPPPEPVPVADVTPLIDMFAVGWTEHRALWQRILTPTNLASIEALAAQAPESFTFPPDLWAHVVYDFAVVYNKGERDPDRIIDSLLPIYQARLASLWHDVAGLTPIGREGTVSAQATEFEAARDYLLGRWEAYQPWIDSAEPR